MASEQQYERRNRQTGRSGVSASAARLTTCVVHFVHAYTRPRAVQTYGTDRLKLLITVATAMP